MDLIKTNGKVVWVETLLEDHTLWPIQIFYDNISSIMLPKYVVFHVRAKYINVHYQYVHEKVIGGLWL